MAEKGFEVKNEFYTFQTDGCGNGGVGLTVYRPTEETPRSKIAVLAMHATSYMGFYPMVEMAKRGFSAAGISPRRSPAGSGPEGWLLDCKTCIDFLKSLPGIEQVVLMAHSQGGCMLSCYQYLAENGAKRFQSTERAIPFPELPALTPADGLMLLDANYGIMHVLAMDPAVKHWDSGYERIPELDIFNPENGYSPDGAHYSKEFVRRFQKAQIKMYKELFAYAQERMELIKKGKGRFADDEPILIPGGAGGSSNNKPFCLDTSLLGRTSSPQPLLHADGTVTDSQIVHTVRTPVNAVSSSLFRGAVSTTVKTVLQQELKFDDDFGYDECTMWGLDGNFNYLSTRENVKGIHVPLLCQGNTASHEFVNTEFNFLASASEDRTIIMSEGSCHDFTPVDSKYGDTLKASCDYFADWLAKPGRFLK